ncbi:hypothetical protein FA592_14185 [Sulfurospirillum diekertiae]|uniref:Uncharacterized protein n=1 Tax=Sulfurospirillum diekertiae TaxID=1854492 RepID=A0A7H1JH15_9BACT|nr:hypothetical protein [Sulfurospirillum diekertiae]QNA70443.1 hypothetical protein FA584_14095 [Sulfurospirillum diekertiae]QNT10489.1 hypothetical protein FA592_14185 [Sulfurospirillum diekertiae]
MLEKEIQKTNIILILMIYGFAILMFTQLVQTVEMNKKIDVLIEKADKKGVN